MNKKLKKLFKNPKAYFYDYFRKQVRARPSGPVSLAVKIAFANAKTDLGYGNEIRKYLRQGKLEQAEKICIEGIGVVPRAISPIVLFADVSMRKGDFAEALNRWQKVIEKFPHKPDGYAGEARAYAALGDYEHVEQLSRNSIKNMPQELWPYIELAEISMRKGDFGEAIERWRVVRKKFPDKVQGYVRASVACCNLGRFAEAEELCRECMKVAPGDCWPYAEYTEVSLRQRDFDEALKRCQTVRERFPKRAVGYVRAAWAYSEIKEYPKAEDLCRKGMEAAPKDIRSFAEYAEISMRKGDFKEASNRWEIVRDKFPRRFNGYIGGGRACIELHEYNKSESIYREALKITNKNSTKYVDLLYMMMDSILKQHGRAKDCISILSDIEQKYSGEITDRRYYSALEKILLPMLGRDKEKVDSLNTDFILIRMLNEPLCSTGHSLALHLFLYRFPRYKDANEALKKHLQDFIQNQHISNPLAVLASATSTDEERLNAYLTIFRNNWYHSVEICYFQPQNFKMLSKACDAITDSGNWQSFKPDMMFNFARTVIYTNQDKGDELISKIFELNKDKNLPVSDPVGLLCFRHKNRQKLIKSASSLSDGKKLNIAICICGQLRGYKGNLEVMVKALGIENHNYKVFVHTWKNIGRKFPRAVFANRTFSDEFAKTYYECFINSANLQEYLKSKYPNFYNLLISSTVASLDDLIKEYKTSDIVIDDEDDGPFSSWDNQKKMHYKIFAAYKLAMESSEKFDLVIRIRPDLKRECKEPFDLNEIYHQSRKHISIFTTGAMILWGVNDDYIIDDNFAMGIPQAMNVYANTFDDLTWHERQSTYSRPKVIVGHTTLEHNLFYNGVHIDKFEKQITGSFQDPEKISIKDIYASLCKDVENRPSISDDQHLLDACKKDMAQLKN